SFYLSRWARRRAAHAAAGVTAGAQCPDAAARGFGSRDAVLVGYKCQHSLRDRSLSEHEERRLDARRWPDVVVRARTQRRQDRYGEGDSRARRPAAIPPRRWALVARRARPAAVSTGARPHRPRSP